MMQEVYGMTAQNYPKNSVSPRATNATGGNLCAWALGVGISGICVALFLPRAFSVLAVFFMAVFQLQCFFLQHEAGHGTLFRSPKFNRWAGHGFSLVTLIPFTSWKVIHRAHHRWAGWQDRDPTTADLVPRARSPLFLAALDIAWKFGIPVIGLAYRFGAFWKPNVVAAHCRNLQELKQAHMHTKLFLAGSALCIGVLAQGELLLPWCLAFFAQSIIFDWVVLFQHSHIPQRLAHSAPVKPFSSLEQMSFTRSLDLPKWVTKTLTFGFEHHEWHHAYPHVPGPQLAALNLPRGRVSPAFHWLRAAKGLKARSLLFENSSQTGTDL